MKSIGLAAPDGRSAPPRRQKRGLERLESLVAAGKRMLNERSLAELSIGDLCREVNATTGAFYNQFESKDDFFRVVQASVCEQRRSEFEAFMQEVQAQDPEPAEMVARLVRNYIEHMRQDGGVLRASLLNVRADADWWGPFRELGAHHRKMLEAWLAPKLTHIKRSERPMRIAFAHQALAGTIVHTILNRPGTLGLHDEAFVRELVRLVQGYLELPRA